MKTATRKALQKEERMWRSYAKGQNPRCHTAPLCTRFYAPECRTSAGEWCPVAAKCGIDCKGTPQSMAYDCFDSHHNGVEYSAVFRIFASKAADLVHNLIPTEERHTDESYIRVYLKGEER